MAFAMGNCILAILFDLRVSVFMFVNMSSRVGEEIRSHVKSNVNYVEGMCARFRLP